jgi:hypothetical protein
MLSSPSVFVPIVGVVVVVAVVGVSSGWIGDGLIGMIMTISDFHAREE